MGYIGPSPASKRSMLKDNLRDDKMYIKLKSNAASLSRSVTNSCYSENFYQLMKKNEGKWVEVDTTYLFRDAFNSKIVHESFDGNSSIKCTHIPARYVLAVKNDARIGKKRCNYCGKISVYEDKLGRKHKTCPYCHRDDYIHIFNPIPNTSGIIC